MQVVYKDIANTFMEITRDLSWNPELNIGCWNLFLVHERHTLSFYFIFKKIKFKWSSQWPQNLCIFWSFSLASVMHCTRKISEPISMIPLGGYSKLDPINVGFSIILLSSMSSSLHGSSSRIYCTIRVISISGIKFMKWTIPDPFKLIPKTNPVKY